MNENFAVIGPSLSSDIVYKTTNKEVNEHKPVILGTHSVLEAVNQTTVSSRFRAIQVFSVFMIHLCVPSTVR